jgi:Zn-dependent M28 family amino/carboxypeptidase
MALRYLAFAVLALSSAAVAQDAPLPDDQRAMKAHVMFLASDTLRGREAGSAEFMIAADYVAAQFYAAGLKPAGDGGSYIQKVPLVTYRAADHGDVVLTRPGAAPVRLAFGEDYTPGVVATAAQTALDAPVVFVGYGLVAPDYHRDDYAGVDVRGKIVAFFGGAPLNFQSEERAHFQNPTTKAVIAAAHGAVGAIVLTRAPLWQGGAHYDRPRTTWAHADGTGDAPGVPILATLSGTGAAKLFVGAKTPWAQIASRVADSNAILPAEPLGIEATIALHTRFEPAASGNVAALLPGSDPKLGREIVVLSAHLDHLGVGPPDAKGDTIYNGAEDNAVGVASLIEEARRFQVSGKRPRRSILFLALTAEEKGLVGSDYFAKHPTVPLATIVADVNLDMPILTYPFEDMIAFGADRSSLGPIVAQAVGTLGVTLSPDPDPGQGFFVRSDHYRFVQQGVPSVFLWPGQKGPGKAATDDFLAHHYHQPSDDLSQPIDWAQGIRFVDANYAIARAIADGDQRPRWNKGDFFGLLYGGYGAK